MSSIVGAGACTPADLDGDAEDIDVAAAAFGVGDLLVEGGSERASKLDLVAQSGSEDELRRSYQCADGRWSTLFELGVAGFWVADVPDGVNTIRTAYSKGVESYHLPAVIGTRCRSAQKTSIEMLDMSVSVLKDCSWWEARPATPKDTQGAKLADTCPATSVCPK